MTAVYSVAAFETTIDYVIIYNALAQARMKSDTDCKTQLKISDDKKVDEKRIFR